MSWARLDDGFHRNPKQLRMSDGAFRLYVCALSYCAAASQPTGYLSAEETDALRRALRKPARIVAELVTLNAWEAIEGGYLIHDYEEYVERGSRDRVRKHRAMKRDGNVTETSQGNVTETFLARDGYPSPNPVPIPEEGFKNPPESPLVENSGNPNGLTAAREVLEGIRRRGQEARRR